LVTANSVHSVTIGKFTVFDGESPSGTGCNGIKITDNGSVDAGLSRGTGDGDTGGDYGNAFFFSDVIGPASPATSSTDFVAPASETVGIGQGVDFGNLLFQAILEDGTSMVTGDVGDATSPTALASGLHPCADVGGVSGQ
jgi:hypothetical protein